MSAAAAAGNTPPPRRLSPRRAGIPSLVLAGLITFTGCGGGSADSPTGTQPTAPTSTAVPQAAHSELAAAASVNQDGTSTIVTAVVPKVDIYKSPIAASVVSQLSNPNEAGAPRVFLVVAKLPGWWQVLLPVQPAGTTGWVKDAQVKASQTSYRVEVARKEHRLRVYDKQQVVVDEPTAVGTGDTPTPGGKFYLTELLQPRNPAGAYGPYAFGLSGFSTTLDSFEGRAPVIGIHGTNQPNLLGQDVSHGCIRVSNETITRLARLLPLGTPVEIVA
nr:MULTISPECIES: L,D-transpeptidase [Protofrankia]